MPRLHIKINSTAIGQIAKGGAVAAVISAATEAIAANVRGSGILVEGDPGSVSLPVETSMGTTDRARGRVTITHPAGQAVQAKHGVLTQGAAGSGFEVSG